jgi:hypothetical protein
VLACLCVPCLQMVRPTNEMDRVHNILRLDDHPELEVSRSRSGW